MIRYQDLMDVTNILGSLPWSLDCVTMIWPKRTRSLSRSRRLLPRLFTALLLVFASLCGISTTHLFTHYLYVSLIHWGRVTHICVSKLTIIGSDNGLSPDRRQAIIWTNAGLLLIGPLETNFSEILIEILTFSFKKMRLKVSSAKRRPFCLGLNVLNQV